MRPGEKDGLAISTVVRRILPEVVEWRKSSDDDPDEAKIATDLEAVLLTQHSAFAGAKYLDALGWEADARLVGLLAASFETLEAEIVRRTRSWVVTCKIEPRYKIGDAVTYLGTKHGKVVGIVAEDAQYKFLSDEEAASRWPYPKIVPYEEVDPY